MNIEAEHIALGHIEDITLGILGDGDLSKDVVRLPAYLLHVPEIHGMELHVLVKIEYADYVVILHR